MNTEKLLITDADGVLINWSRGFCMWMHERGFKEVTKTSYNLRVRFNLPETDIRRLVDEYNRSAAVSFLSAMPGSVLIMGKLRELGYVTHCVTSFGGDTYSQIQRCKLLWDYFRIPSENVHFLPLDGNKIDILKKWEGTGAPWIEDKVENAEDGLTVGLNSILLRSDHTNAYVSEQVFVANTWYEIYAHITGEEKCQTSGSSYTFQSPRSMAM